MKPTSLTHLAAGLILAAAAGASSAQVGLSLSVGSPGFYGAIDIGGGVPPPAVVYQQPMLIGPAAVGVAPLYLYVPPEQYGSWGVYCGYYNACNRPVYFVQPTWYQRTYVPYYRSHRGYYDGRRSQFAGHAYRGPAHDMHRPGAGPRPNDHRPPAEAMRRGGPAPAAHLDNRRAPPATMERRGAPAPAPHMSNNHPQERHPDNNHHR